MPEYSPFLEWAGHFLHWQKILAMSDVYEINSIYAILLDIS